MKKNECLLREIECEFCNKKLVAKDKETHLNSCASKEVLCTNGCGKKIAKKDEQKHLGDDCQNTLVECEYNCKDKVMKKDLKQHNVEYLEEHFERLKLLLLDKSLENNTKSIEEINKSNESLLIKQKELMKTKEELSKTQLTVKKLLDENNEFKKQLKKIKKI